MNMPSRSADIAGASWVASDRTPCRARVRVSSSLPEDSMNQIPGHAAAALVLLCASTSAASPAQAPVAPASPAASPAPATTPAPPQTDFPGQYAPSPAAWRFPVWPSGCKRFTGEEARECLDFIASDFGRLSRFAAANAALAPPRQGEHRVVFFGDSITDNWSKAGYGGFFPGRPYVNRGIGGQTTSQMLLRFRADVLALTPRAVVILAGTNDVAGNSGPVSDAAIEDNLATMAEAAHTHGVRVILASILPVCDDKKDATGRPIVRTTDRPPARLTAISAWMQTWARDHDEV